MEYTANDARNWEWFALNNQDELFYVIYKMIVDKINEVVPQMIDNYMREHLRFDMDINTFMNGKSIKLSGIKEEIANEIIRNL